MMIQAVLNFENFNFNIVSDLVLRISNLFLIGYKIKNAFSSGRLCLSW